MTVLLQDLQTVLNPLAAGGASYLINEAEPPTLPYIVFQRVVSTANATLQDNSNLQNTRVQIDIYGVKISDAEAINDALLAALRAGPWRAVVDISAQDVYEPDTRLYRIIRDVSVWATN